jgi:hypothetical protein
MEVTENTAMGFQNQSKNFLSIHKKPIVRLNTMGQKKSREFEVLDNQFHIAEKFSESNGNLLKVCETSSLDSSISNLKSHAILNNLIAGSSSRDKIKSKYKKTSS